MFDAHRDDLAEAQAFLGLGSNVGAREWNVLRAAHKISGVCRVTGVSSLYETEPVGCAPMRPFINAVMKVEIPHPAEKLLSRLQALEKELGRSGGHNQPREIDIDIITVGDQVSETSSLTLPHPRYAQRRFVLVPLREIAPEFVCPASGRHIDDLIRGAGAEGTVDRVSSRMKQTTLLHSEV